MQERFKRLQSVENFESSMKQGGFGGLPAPFNNLSSTDLAAFAAIIKNTTLSFNEKVTAVTALAQGYGDEYVAAVQNFTQTYEDRQAELAANVTETLKELQSAVPTLLTLLQNRDLSQDSLKNQTMALIDGLESPMAKQALGMLAMAGAMGPGSFVRRGLPIQPVGTTQTA
ncbi:unnamed protein product, partial [Mesorhabditis spiculigera]